MFRMIPSLPSLALSLSLLLGFKDKVFSKMNRMPLVSVKSRLTLGYVNSYL